MDRNKSLLAGLIWVFSAFSGRIINLILADFFIINIAYFTLPAFMKNFKLSTVMDFIFILFMKIYQSHTLEQNPYIFTFFVDFLFFAPFTLLNHFFIFFPHFFLTFFTFPFYTFSPYCLLNCSKQKNKNSVSNV